MNGLVCGEVRIEEHIPLGSLTLASTFIIIPKKHPTVWNAMTLYKLDYFPIILNSISY